MIVIVFLIFFKVDSTGTIQYKLLRQHLQNLFQAKWAHYEMKTIQRKCFFEAQEYSAIDNIAVDQCNPQTYYFDVCLYRELAELCPKFSQIDIAECKQRNEILNKSNEKDSSHDGDNSSSSSSEEGFFGFLFS